MSVVQRHNVTISGAGQTPMLFAHGFGCDQHMWRFVAPAFEPDHRVIRFDHIGAGQSDRSAYHPARYQTLDGYADDVLEICHALDLSGTIFVGHSVSAMIGILAALKAPQRFAQLVLIAPSPCYINSDGYVGGFERDEIQALLEFLDRNYLGWSRSLAPTIMGNGDRPDLGAELTSSFCRTEPTIARQFARVTFLADHRADLPRLTIPSLILQCRADVLAPEAVGQYMQRHLAQSQLTMLHATGHCPHLSAPEETIAAIQAYVEDSKRDAQGHHA